MSEGKELTQAAILEMVEKAKGQSAELIEKLLREAIGDFEDSGSDGFKLTLTVEGERKGMDAMLTIQTKGQTAVELKRKDSTCAEVVDWGPSLFDNLDGGGQGGGGRSSRAEPKLLTAAPKLLTAATVTPEEEPETLEGVAETVEEDEDGGDREDNEDGGDEGTAGTETGKGGKPKTITISSTSVFEGDGPEDWPRLTTVRKEGVAVEGEVVHIMMKNPDMSGSKVDMGLYRCVSAAPRNEWDREAGRCEYAFERIEDEGEGRRCIHCGDDGFCQNPETGGGYKCFRCAAYSPDFDDGPVNGGGDLGDEED